VCVCAHYAVQASPLISSMKCTHQCSSLPLYACTSWCAPLTMHSHARGHTHIVITTITHIHTACTWACTGAEVVMCVHGHTREGQLRTHTHAHTRASTQARQHMRHLFSSRSAVSLQRLSM